MSVAYNKLILERCHTNGIMYQLIGSGEGLNFNPFKERKQV